MSILAASAVAQGPLYVQLTKFDALCDNGSAQVAVTGGTPSYTVTWSTGITGYILSNAVPADYTVTVTDALSNDTTIVFSIIDEECEVGISNHFTPNDDGYNDLWAITHLNYYPDFELFVYNRWGQLVHRQSQVYSPWDGTHLGVPLPDGAYYYVFYFDKNNKKKLLQGDVNILR